jgi:hypothetical protein
MKIIKNLKFAGLAALAALAATLLFQTSIARADDHGKAVPPSNPMVILLEGTYGPVVDAPDLFPPEDLNNGNYKTVPIYNIDSGVPAPNDEVVGNFYAFGGHGIVTYDLRKGGLRAKFIPELEDTEVIPDGAGGIYINGTYELDILVISTWWMYCIVSVPPPRVSFSMNTASAISAANTASHNLR